MIHNFSTVLTDDYVYLREYEHARANRARGLGRV